MTSDDPTRPDDLTLALLHELRRSTDTAGVSLPRLGKRLGLASSVLLRRLSWMGDATIGSQPGPGWVQVTRQGERWTAALTDTGRRWCEAHLDDTQPPAPPPAACAK